MEWGTPVLWGRYLLFCVLQSVKTKETTRPGSPTPCKQAQIIQRTVMWKTTGMVTQGDLLSAVKKSPVAKLFFFRKRYDLQVTRINNRCICFHLLSRLKIKRKYMISGCGSLSRSRSDTLTVEARTSSCNLLRNDFSFDSACYFLSALYSRHSAVNMG